VKLSKIERYIGLGVLSAPKKPQHPLAMDHDSLYSPTELEIAYRIRSEMFELRPAEDAA